MTNSIDASKEELAEQCKEWRKLCYALESRTKQLEQRLKKVTVAEDSCEIERRDKRTKAEVLGEGGELLDDGYMLSADALPRIPREIMHARFIEHHARSISIDGYVYKDTVADMLYGAAKEIRELYCKIEAEGQVRGKKITDKEVVEFNKWREEADSELMLDSYDMVLAWFSAKGYSHDEVVRVASKCQDYRGDFISVEET